MFLYVFVTAGDMKREQKHTVYFHIKIGRNKLQYLFIFAINDFERNNFILLHVCRHAWLILDTRGAPKEKRFGTTVLIHAMFLLQ